MSPIDCEEVLREIELYLDGEIQDRSLRREIDVHLSACSPCLDRADFRRRLKSIVHEKCGREEIPSNLLERIRSVLESD